MNTYAYALRLPRSFEEALKERAKKEGVSVNTLIVAYIARGLGEDS